MVTDINGAEHGHNGAKVLLTRAGTRASYAIVLSLASAAIVATAVLSYRAIDRELTEAALSRRAALAQLAASTLSEKFEHLVVATVSLATRVRFSELVAAGRWVEAAEILRAVPQDLPFVERLFLADVDGTLMADVPQLPDVRGRRFAHRDWYKGVRRNWQPYVSPVYKRAAVPRLNVVAAAAPIKDANGRVSGILVLQVQIGNFFEWAKEIDSGLEGFVYVVDAEGQIAFHSKFPGATEIRDFSSAPVVQKLHRGERGVEIAFDPFAGEDTVSAYAPVPGFGWGVVAQQPARTAFAARNQQLRRMLIAYGLILLFFVSVIYLAARIVVQRRQAEESRRVTSELERRVAERTAQLESTNKELESFSYSVSHDLRVPLRAIDGFARMLQEDYEERLDDEGRRLLGVVRENARKMGHLIDDLLAFSRLGRKSIAAEEIDMKSQAGAVFAELANGDRRIRLELGDLPRAWGDPALVRQIWQNLISNAIKFSARDLEPKVTVSGRIEDAATVYSVRDNGVGFDMRYYDKLFGVFQRLHSPEEYPGTGVGLAIVHRVVTRHGGRVWAEGEEGKGAAFYFALPGKGQ